MQMNNGYIRLLIIFVNEPRKYCKILIARLEMKTHNYHSYQNHKKVIDLNCETNHKLAFFITEKKLIKYEIIYTHIVHYTLPYY